MLHRLTSRLKLLSIAAGATLAMLLWQSPAKADPALWVLRDDDSTIYLFGTIHVMKPGIAWQTPDVYAAFSASSELWVEEADDENQTAMIQLVQRYGQDPQHPLSSKLTPEQHEQLVVIAQRLKINPAALEPLRPWLVALQLVVIQMQQLGYDPDKGVDHGLRMAAKASGRPIRAFETSEQQVRIFADLPPQDELLTLVETLRDISKGPDFIAAMLKDWMSGNTSALDAEITADMRNDSPTLYKALFLNRNIAWTKQIEHLLAGKGTAFIAVGTGHLVGTDSVIALLERDGYKVMRK